MLLLHSVEIKSIDRQEICEAVAVFASQLRARHKEIRKMIWFGSWVNGLPCPGSDVDLCIVLSESGKCFCDRIPEFLPVGFPVGVDVFPYTVSEFKALEMRHPEWFAAIQAGVEI